MSTATCVACGERFDLDFALDQLVAAIEPSLDGVAPAGGGRFQLEDGARFRVPTGEDELVVSASPEPMAVLVDRCVEAGAIDADRLGDLLDRVAPMIDLALDATCASCGHDQQVHFELQSFLLGRLIAERASRATEVHRLARGYGWSLNEILSLPRSQRRSYVDLVEHEAGLR